MIQEIDGYNIITNIYSAGGLIDPVATQKVVAVEVGKTDVWTEIEAVKSQMQIYANQAVQARRNSRDATNGADKKRFWDEYKARELQMSDLREDLRPLIVLFDRKRKELTLEHAVYFHPAQGEEMITDEHAETVRAKMVEATAEGKVVDKDLNKIDNFRGCKFWKKVGDAWTKTEITKLGVKPPASAIEEKDLTEPERNEVNEQIEIDRIAALSSTEKLAEKNNVLAALVGRAAMMKSELDITGDPDPLGNAQAWLAAETALVEIKYA